ncbi:SURF1 family cytochrome oxidase biogenesis protein [Galbitalea sp. SE-J8]|uniref:SURF1 family protein n=1 Tax=Galbitalea sp. SE-J8 TaxID=3054952 RepID=UPI00259CAC04|nr:SURF1 family cytochrome oxidase biogenesis protein [Galbitalea sp. SE-J8]MDM4761430.1 SURF1 family cytochrome oxidase biogenesis protein [Galbitalea sp. SE-J8]
MNAPASVDPRAATAPAPPHASVWALARTPRWILALVGALAVACVFGALGQWQISRAIATATVETRPTEAVVPLDSIARPQSAVTNAENERMVSVTAVDEGDYALLGGRYNGGERGYWVVAHYLTRDGVSLAVAAGWTADRSTAETLVASGAAVRESQGNLPVELIGRYLASESPVDDEDPEAAERTALSVPTLVNQWAEPATPVYGGYLVASEPTLRGLTAIDSPVPEENATLNWLNVFYAVEWAVFALLAFYLWYRLLRDAHERELEDAEDAAAEEAEAAAARGAAASVASVAPATGRE